MDETIGDLAGRWFAKAVLDDNTQASTHELIENVKEAFKERLKQIDWIDEETLKGALKKVSIPALIIKIDVSVSEFQIKDWIAGLFTRSRVSSRAIRWVKNL